MSQNSKISITGKNFLVAVAVSLIATFTLTLLASFASLFFKLTAKETIETAATSASYLLNNFYLALLSFAKCAVPIVTLLAFTLLQRFRIKD